MSYCSKCGKEVLEGSSFCGQCGENLSPSPGNAGISSAPMNEELASFVGKNSEKYLKKFASFTAGGTDSFKATWHWPAFFVPFWWMLYRKIYGFAILAFFLGLIPYVGLLTHFIWAILANYIYYKHARKKVDEIKQLHPAPETQKAVIAVTGGVGNAALIIGLIIGVIGVIGILAAIAIPNFVAYKEKARKAAVIRSMSTAEPELKAWLYSSLKAKEGSMEDERELDTDGNGSINNDDLTDVQLSDKGVCNQYVIMKNSAENGSSPWDVNAHLWSINAGNGQIQCMQSADNSVTLTATDKNGMVIDTRTITAER